MNPKNLEGKTPAEQKDMYEVELIAEFEMAYGDESNWTDDQVNDFNKRWEEIQEWF